MVGMSVHIYLNIDRGCPAHQEDHIWKFTNHSLYLLNFHDQPGGFG